MPSSLLMAVLVVVLINTGMDCDGELLEPCCRLRD